MTCLGGQLFFDVQMNALLCLVEKIFIDNEQIHLVFYKML